MKAVNNPVAQALVFPQADFHLTVQKEGLQTLSTKELEKLAEDISIMIQSHIMSTDLQVMIQIHADGVMISTNA